jgi:hypothetical protein
MTDYAALKAEISKPEYDGLTDEQIAAAINGVTVTQYVSFSPAEAMLALIAINTVDWGWLCGVASGDDASAQADTGKATVAVNPMTRRIAVSIRDLFQLPLSVAITTADQASAIGAGLAALVAANVITQVGMDRVVALATTTQTWAQANGWPQGLNAGEIEAARVYHG